ncbi:MAG TPA: branched-chain amino acid aminotransferase [Chitinophagaceae bacterium]|nr:branched-chain amino acid aminotransferase [Chitinophagaceae bacterium]
METVDIIIRKTKHSRITEVDFMELGFGTHVSDHMFLCDYFDGEWQLPQIVPFANLSLSPATLALHYGQTVFEGMKAFLMEDNRVNIFRMYKHHERINRSLERMCMPGIPESIFVESLQQLVSLDKNWVPGLPGSSLYLRPFVYASEARFGVKVSEQYRFVVFTGPVAPIYPRPLKVKVETHYIRAARGGTGAAKCGGNYGGAMYPTELARQEGYDQVLWTDALEHQYIEESGTMNVMFVIDGALVSPPPSDSVLDGITRDCLITLARDLGYEAIERPVSIRELEAAFSNNTITEAFGAGTAAVVAPIETIGINGTDYHLPKHNQQSLSHAIKHKLEAIRSGRHADTYGWNFVI